MEKKNKIDNHLVNEKATEPNKIKKQGKPKRKSTNKGSNIEPSNVTKIIRGNKFGSVHKSK